MTAVEWNKALGKENNALQGKVKSNFALALKNEDEGDHDAANKRLDAAIAAETEGK